MLSGLVVAALVAGFVTALQAQGGATRSVWTGVYSRDQAARGGPLYAKSCALCHGPELEGGEMAPPLSGGSFNANWNGLTLGDLLERIRISMPQDNPNSLPRQTYIDILAFMLRSGGFPDGTSDLPRETEVLEQITFESAKP